MQQKLETLKLIYIYIIYIDNITAQTGIKCDHFIKYLIWFSIFSYRSSSVTRPGLNNWKKKLKKNNFYIHSVNVYVSILVLYLIPMDSIEGLNIILIYLYLFFFTFVSFLKFMTIETFMSFAFWVMGVQVEVMYWHYYQQYSMNFKMHKYI